MEETKVDFWHFNSCDYYGFPQVYCTKLGRAKFPNLNNLEPVCPHIGSN